MRSETAPIRVIIDTNLWISFLIGKRLRALGPLLINDNVELVFSTDLLQELITVCTRPKFKKYFNPKHLLDLISLLKEKAIWVEDYTLEFDFEDPKNHFLLGMGIKSKSDYLVTGDKALLLKAQIEQMKIIDVNRFQSILENLNQIK